MASIKVLLRKRENRDGSRPLILQIIKDRKASTTNLGYSIFSKDWDDNAQRVKKSHPNSARLNNLIANKIAEANNTAIEIETHTKIVSSQAIMNKVIAPKHRPFLIVAEEYLENLKKNGNFNVYTSNKPRIERFREFLKGKDIAFADITANVLERFKIHLRNTRDITERTVMNHLSAIRSVYTFAFEDKDERRKYSPFGEGKIMIVFPPSTKIGLIPADVKKLEKVVLVNPSYDHARNLWLIAYYFAGMRISDVFRLKWSDIQNDHIYYTMGKTGKGKKVMITKNARKIFMKYEGNRTEDNDFIFDDLKGFDPKDKFNLKRRIAEVTSRYDKFLRLKVAPLAGTAGKITMHVARHTFATQAGESGVALPVIQGLLGHGHISTTVEYMTEMVNRGADNALSTVLESATTTNNGDAKFGYLLIIYVTFSDREFRFITDAMKNCAETSFETELGGFWYGYTNWREAAKKNSGRNQELDFTTRQFNQIIYALGHYKSDSFGQGLHEKLSRILEEGMQNLSGFNR